jgi:hypothetical protein
VLVEPSQENDGVYRLLVRGLDVGFGYDDSYVHQDVQQPPYVELTMHFPDTEDGNYMIGSEPLAVGTYEVLIYSGDPPAGSWLIDGQGSGRWVSWGTFEVVPATEK